MSVPATPLEDLRESVLEAAGELARASSNGEHERASASRRAQVTLEAPPRADFGDYSTNAALLLAPVLKQPPREVEAEEPRPAGDGPAHDGTLPASREG